MSEDDEYIPNTNEKFSYWYAIFLVVFSSLVIIISLIKFARFLLNNCGDNPNTSLSKNDSYHQLG
jgi:hypothetical protein